MEATIPRRIRNLLGFFGFLVIAGVAGALTWAHFHEIRQMQDALDRNQPDSLRDIKNAAQDGVSLRTRAADGTTVAMVAAYWNDPDLLQRALAAGVDPNAQDKWGNSALLESAFAINPECARLLLKAGADPNLATHSGDTPLIQAVRNARSDLIPLLLDAGAKRDAANDKGETPISIARTLGPGGLHPIRPDLTPADFVRMLSEGRPKDHELAH